VLINGGDMMITTRPEVRKLNFFDVFESNFMREEISVGIHEEVIITINYPESFTLDKDMFMAIWTNGEKISFNETIASTVNAEALFSDELICEEDLEESLKRLSKLSIDISYSKQGERHKNHYNLFDVASSSDADGNLMAVTMEVKCLDILNWLFSEDLMKLLKK
jgi:hypothetical protein